MVQGIYATPAPTATAEEKTPADRKASYEAAVKKRAKEEGESSWGRLYKNRSHFAEMHIF